MDSLQIFTLNWEQTYAAMNKKDKASQMFDKAIELQSEILGSNHPDLSYTYTAIGLMHSDMNDEQKASNPLEKLIKYNHNIYQIIIRILYKQTKHFADLYMKKEDYDQVLYYYHKALEYQLKTLPLNHPAVADTYRTIGFVYWKKKDYQQALTFFINYLIANFQGKNLVIHH